ncbi:DUF6463 family protein [Tsukamurella pseudospumae]|uniref:DUF6463 family protein n=1 Tax=Tsukamurella pseudospumae TaxID=239498 RepID=UPI00083879B1|nr:DUF6463 family protein [Tsukamurella pseudospumae]
MIRWAGRLIVVFGVAHTVLALGFKGRAHARTWVGGGIRNVELGAPEPASSAYWFSLNSFGVPMALLGALVLRLDRRGEAPSYLLAGVLAAWTAQCAVVLTRTPWPIMAAASGLLFEGTRRARRDDRRAGTHAASDVSLAVTIS